MSARAGQLGIFDANAVKVLGTPRCYDDAGVSLQSGTCAGQFGRQSFSGPKGLEIVAVKEAVLIVSVLPTLKAEEKSLHSWCAFHVGGGL